MIAFSTVGDVFSDPEFAAPGNSLLWGLGGLDETCKDCSRFLVMPQGPHTWRVHSHGCYKDHNADFVFRTSLSSFISVSPTFQDLTSPRAVIRLNAVRKGRWARLTSSAPQAACAAIRIEHNDHADPAQCSADQHACPPTACCKYWPDGKTSCAPHHATTHRLDVSAPSLRSYESSLLLLLPFSRAWTAPIRCRVTSET